MPISSVAWDIVLVISVMSRTLKSSWLVVFAGRLDVVPLAEQALDLVDGLLESVGRDRP